MYDGSISGGHTVWLSGAVITPLNKYVMPTLWLTALIAIPLWLLIAVEGFEVTRVFVLLALGVLALTVWLMWFSVKLERVGYNDRNLIVSSYFREAIVPFEMVDTVEPVWWYRGRLVRVRFRDQTPFGDAVYYMPAWGAIRCLWARPDKELLEIVQDGRMR